MAQPRAGIHYPRSLGEFQAWFRSDIDCLDYLEWLRWPDGWTCRQCGHREGWRLGDRRIMCPACGFRTTVTAGTIFDKTRTPLTVWFAVCWQFSTTNGVSAASVKRILEIGSYQTAWAMLHRLRSVLVRPGRDRLTGLVEVDETFIGGEESGVQRGRLRDKKSLVAVAVELKEGRGYGRCRMGVIEDSSAASLHRFLTDHVEPGATIITDAWEGYGSIERLGYIHDRRSQRAAKARAEDPYALLPGVHRVVSLAKRWLLGTHQSSVEEGHLASYLDEFVFRFNRRRSRSRGLLFYRVLELAVGHEPVRYDELIAHKRPRPNRPMPFGSPGHPPSLDRPLANRPWRTSVSPRSA